jgi:hypothetical protein
VASPGLGNGDTLTAFAVCPTQVIGGGYTIAGVRPADQEKLIAFQNFPSDPQIWTVTVGANANVQAFTLTVYGVCQ